MLLDLTWMTLGENMISSSLIDSPVGVTDLKQLNLT